jgi:NADPH2:quinone reductase
MNKPAPSFRAHVCREYGDHRELAMSELPLSAPGPGEVLIRNRAFAVGFPDLLTIQGKYQRKPALPFVPGSEFCGEVAAVGDNVSQLCVGELVIGNVLIGAYAEMIIAPAENCLKLPQPFNFIHGAAFQTAYKTAYVGLVERGNLQAGETLLVHGAAGGVGLAAVELGKVLGARVIATASGTDKLGVAIANGADDVIDGSDASFGDAVKALTGGAGANVIFDPVGGDTFDESLHCIAPFGRLLVIGFASGRIPAVPANYPLLKQISIVGVRAGEFGRLDPAGGRRVNAALLDLANADKLHPHIHRQLPFDGVIRAFDEIVDRTVAGRIVVLTGQ